MLILYGIMSSAVKLYNLPMEERSFTMIFESCKEILYSDTLVPDIFITEYMPSMNGDFVKVYLYCLFLSKHQKYAPAKEMAKNLEMDEQVVRDALMHLENAGIISRTDTGFTMTDLKDREIKKVFRPKLTSTPEEALHSSERNKRRNSIITAINNMFFQGMMSPSWYTDIDAWFDRYKFEEDVMLALFKHCSDHHGLSKNYIAKVAESWHSKNICNAFDLDRYFIEYQKFKDIRLKVVKKLNLKRNLTSYEEEYIEKWTIDYGYGFEIIDLALKQTVSKFNPNFKYIDALLTDWHGKALKTVAEVTKYMEQNKKSTTKKKSSTEKQIPQHSNFKQRKYDKSSFNELYENLGS